MHYASWINERLPEILWCALLATHRGRDQALDTFRRTAKWAKAHESALPQEVDLGHSGMSRMSPELRADLLSVICSHEDDRRVLSSLLLLAALPDRDDWERALRGASTPDGWDLLRLAVANVFDHQSQLATDCRWARVIFKILGGQLFFSEAQRDLVEQLLGYPDVGDQRSVRPTVRAMEISFSRSKDEVPPPWPSSFWLEVFEKTTCIPGALTPPRPAVAPGTTRAKVDSVAMALATLAFTSRTSTDIDARAEAAFGIAAYGISVMRELLSLGNSTAVLGRLGLRTLLELHITLAYLAKKDSPATWQAFRAYGAGQAKLALLKFDEDDARAAGFASTDLLEMIANEDRSSEFVEVDLGQWTGSTLRQMAIDAGVKTDYDAFYPWTSAYSHGNWGALRSTTFDLCLNALHRAHRILSPEPNPLGDVVSDSAYLCDKILDTLSALYPGLTIRVSHSAE